jgi:signal peptidase I
MSATSESTGHSPLISVWLTPREAIDQVLRTNSRRHVLLLAGLTGVANIVALLTPAYGFWSGLFNWRIAAAVILGGAVFGIVALYLWGWLLKWVGRPLGGAASMADIRTALAWGGVPGIVGTAICLVGCITLDFFGLASPRALTIAFEIVVGLFGLWTWVCVIRAYKHVQHFGVWRAIASLVLAGLLFLTIPLGIRTFFFQPFAIPSGSGAMIPTLLPGDNFFVSKYSYGYTRFSFPFSPRLFSGRILAAEPQRGDVVVFCLPKDTSVDYIKRVVGLPGDRIQMIGGVLQINAQPVKHERIEDFVTDEGRHIQRYRETLPNGVSFTTLNLADHSFYDDTPLYTVPAGHYFVIGDNLDNSADSRVMSQVGYVPFENLIGRVGLIWLSTTEGAQPTIRYGRIGTVIQ